MDMLSIANNFRDAQLLAIRLSNLDYNPNAACPSYPGLHTLGLNAGIIDGTHYCADCVADEADLKAKEENKINAELFSIGHGDL